MTNDQVKKVVELLETGKVDFSTNELVENAVIVSAAVGDILILALEKEWSANDLKNIAQTILALL